MIKNRGGEPSNMSISQLERVATHSKGWERLDAVGDGSDKQHGREEDGGGLEPVL